MTSSTSISPATELDASDDVASDAHVTAVKQKQQKRPRRTPWLMGAMAVTAMLASFAWIAVHRGSETTDDAQVEGRVMIVSPRVPGQVLRVRVVDNQFVQAGEILVELDPADYAAHVAAARADLSAARASVDAASAVLALTRRNAPASLVQAEGGMTSATASLRSARASVDQARAEVEAASSQHTFASINLQRSQTLFSQSAIARTEVELRQTEFDTASARLEQARAHLAGSEAALATTGGSVTFAQGRLTAAQSTAEQVAAASAALVLAEARVAQAQAALQLAALNLSYTTVRASRAGVVSRRSVEEGQTVSPDRPVMAIVPRDDLWIVANFKEDQLASMRAGQRAEVRFDTFGRRTFAGHVESISNGTGARFALLPPDNASGNFVKVVQRIPVLIRLDGRIDVALRPGMSAEAMVVTGAE